MFIGALEVSLCFRTMAQIADSSFLIGPRTFLLLGPFLNMAAFVISLKDLTKVGDAEACTGKMGSDKPGANYVG